MFLEGDKMTRLLQIVQGLTIMLLLVACSSSLPDSSPLLEFAEDEAIFTDEDIDNAILRLPLTYNEIEGTELPELPITKTSYLDDEPPPSDITALGTLPGAKGIITFLQRRNMTDGTIRYRVVQNNQVTRGQTFIYGGQREITSVDADSSGKLVYVTMRRDRSPSSKIEIFRLDLNTHTVQQLTRNKREESNISVSADGDIFVYRGGFFGRVYYVSYSQQFRSELRNFSLQIYPSVSRNGKFIILVRVKNQRQIIYIYNIATRTYQPIISTSTPLSENQFFYPSVSENGKFVVWHDSPSGRYRIRTVDLLTGEQVIRSLEVDPSHVGLSVSTSASYQICYTRNVSGSSQVITRDLTTSANEIVSDVSDDTTDYTYSFAAWHP
jgi:hypothetical protein